MMQENLESSIAIDHFTLSTDNYCLLLILKAPCHPSSPLFSSPLLFFSLMPLLYSPRLASPHLSYHLTSALAKLTYSSLRLLQQLAFADPLVMCGDRWQIALRRTRSDGHTRPRLLASTTRRRAEPCV
ncbi:unnamed protein product [Hydatigera taeniaeformis]|uniref:Uncharacterized protein n=1 Tax=Hydatigena taeniaeformis TaxID=6205 RepID=A0A0R3XD12_HYDTA|nr:unnamed protein product [Hydatigera taeniaeformis]